VGHVRRDPAFVKLMPKVDCILANPKSVPNLNLILLAYIVYSPNLLRKVQSDFNWTKTGFILSMALCEFAIPEGFLEAEGLGWSYCMLNNRVIQFQHV
jgi:hypothetical protein